MANQTRTEEEEEMSTVIIAGNETDFAAAYAAMAARAPELLDDINASTTWDYHGEDGKQELVDIFCEEYVKEFHRPFAID